MTRKRTIIMAAMVVMSVFGAVPLAATADTTDGSTQEDAQLPGDGIDNQTDENASVSPGAQLAGVVNVHEAEIDGAIDGQAFGLAVARAQTDNAAAAAVGDEINETKQELDELKDKRENLTEAYQNGNISEGKYRAQLAEVHTRTENAKKQLNQTKNESDGLPSDILEANGVNVSAIETLKTEANNLSGQEVAKVAQQIAGPPDGVPGVSHPLSNAPGQTPPDTPGTTDPDSSNGNGNVTTPNDNTPANPNAGGGPPDDTGHGPSR